ncbi:hypothetical protein Hanom_Chr10g00876471 [Helianthus anomalus]
MSKCNLNKASSQPVMATLFYVDRRTVTIQGLARRKSCTGKVVKPHPNKHTHKMIHLYCFVMIHKVLELHIGGFNFYSQIVRHINLMLGDL